MRTCRFRRAGREHYGVLDGASVRALTAEPWAGGLPEGPAHPLSKVVCIGRNYRAHAQELGHDVPREPLLFIKPSTSVIGPGDEIRLPAASQEVHHEAELAVVMGRSLTCGSPFAAREAVFGFTCLDDVTARDIQRAEQHFTRAKSFDTFCPIGPC